MVVVETTRDIYGPIFAVRSSNFLGLLAKGIAKQTHQRVAPVVITRSGPPNTSLAALLLIHIWSKTWRW